MLKRMFSLVLLGITVVILSACSAAQAVAPTLTPYIIIETAAPQPTPTRAAFTGGAADHLLGTDHAYVTIVLYGDFQCTPCIDVARTLEILQSRYPNDVRIVWRHFVQVTDDKAHLAAEASEAASTQGRFWEMHDQLFTHQAEWINLTSDQFRTKLDSYARLIGLDMTIFDQALDQHTYAALVDKATKEAADLDFKSVPVLLFNGLPYSGRIDEFALDGYTRLRLLEKRQFKQAPPFNIDLKKTYKATLVTEKGSVEIDLYPQAAPVTVNNFVFLARQGWYDNITFHRVIPNQLAQTGDPSGSGFGTAGYTIPDELNNGFSFDREGVVAMASQSNARNTGSSQFFISYGPLRPVLDYDAKYTIFGQVTKGMDVLRQLTARDPFDQLHFPNPPPGDKLLSVKISESQ